MLIKQLPSDGKISACTGPYATCSPSTIIAPDADVEPGVMSGSSRNALTRTYSTS